MCAVWPLVRTRELALQAHARGLAYVSTCAATDASPLGTAVLRIKRIPPRPEGVDDYNEHPYDGRGWCAATCPSTLIAQQLRTAHGGV